MMSHSPLMRRNRAAIASPNRSRGLNAPVRSDAGVAGLRAVRATGPAIVSVSPLVPACHPTHTLFREIRIAWPISDERARHVHSLITYHHVSRDRQRRASVLLLDLASAASQGDRCGVQEILVALRYLVDADRDERLQATGSSSGRVPIRRIGELPCVTPGHLRRLFDGRGGLWTARPVVAPIGQFPPAPGQFDAYVELQKMNRTDTDGSAAERHIAGVIYTPVYPESGDHAAFWWLLGGEPCRGSAL